MAPAAGSKKKGSKKSAAGAEAEGEGDDSVDYFEFFNRYKYRRLQGISQLKGVKLAKNPRRVSVAAAPLASLGDDLASLGVEDLTEIGPGPADEPVVEEPVEEEPAEEEEEDEDEDEDEDGDEEDGDEDEEAEVEEENDSDGGGDDDAEAGDDGDEDGEDAAEAEAEADAEAETLGDLGGVTGRLGAVALETEVPSLLSVRPPPKKEIPEGALFGIEFKLPKADGGKGKKGKGKGGKKAGGKGKGSKKGKKGAKKAKKGPVELPLCYGNLDLDPNAEDKTRLVPAVAPRPDAPWYEDVVHGVTHRLAWPRQGAAHLSTAELAQQLLDTVRMDGSRTLDGVQIFGAADVYRAAAGGLDSGLQFEELAACLQRGGVAATLPQLRMLSNAWKAADGNLNLDGFVAAVQPPPEAKKKSSSKKKGSGGSGKGSSKKKKKNKGAPGPAQPPAEVQPPLPPAPAPANDPSPCASGGATGSRRRGAGGAPGAGRWGICALSVAAPARGLFGWPQHAVRRRQEG